VSEPTQRLELLDGGRRIHLAGRAYVIEWRKGTPARPLVKLESVDDRTAADALKGAQIEVPRDEVPLAEGDYLVDDLIGCEVHGGGARVGSVRDVLVLPTVEALEVERGDGGVLLVPMVGDAVRRIDVERRLIEIELQFVDPGEDGR
jgi:16S rRNA processing protein RimM